MFDKDNADFVMGCLSTLVNEINERKTFDPEANTPDELHLLYELNCCIKQNNKPAFRTYAAQLLEALCSN